MGVNFSLFEIGRRALRASQLGVTVTGQNIANVNTPGYTRQELKLVDSYIEGAGFRSVGNGVTIQDVKANRDQFIEARLQTENAINGRLTARRDALSQVDAVFNDTNSDGGLNTSIKDFFGAFRQLEASPGSVPLRASVVEKANALTTNFNTTRNRLTEIQQGVDGELRTQVDSINDLATKVADLNKKIRLAESSGENSAELQNQRYVAAHELGSLTGAHIIENKDSTFSLTFGDGKALVQADTAYKVAAVNSPTTGLATLEIDGQPAVFTDGKIRGLQDAIASVGGYIQSLDDLASSIAGRVNSLHSAGEDLNGNAGTAFFVSSSSGTISAANINVSAALKANPKLVVSATSGAGRADATVARDIAGLLSDSSSVIGTQTNSYSSFFAGLVADVGAGVKATDDALTTQTAIQQQIEAQRESVSGVSLDEEAIHLLQYQRSYEAAARFLKVADEMTQTILALGQ